ncbi:tetratricopeptide repeat protein, partial [Acinetobacter baumannii]
KQDSVEALRWYRKAADLGQPQASRYIAFIYRDGDGVPVDRAEGLRWFRRGAELGDPVAMNDVGFAYYTGAGVARDYGE